MPSARVLDDWVRRDAPRLDTDEDGFFDEAGPAIMDALQAGDSRCWSSRGRGLRLAPTSIRE